MSPAITLGNLGFSEIALVLAAVLMLFGGATGFALHRSGEMDAELHRRHHFGGWMLGGLLLGLTTAAWTNGIVVGVPALASLAAVVLVLAAVARFQASGRATRSLDIMGAAILAIGVGVGSGIAARFVA